MPGIDAETILESEPTAERIASQASVLGRSRRLQHHFDALVLLVAERLVKPGRVFQRAAMRDDKSRIKLAALNSFRERLQITVHRSAANKDSTGISPIFSGQQPTRWPLILSSSPSQIEQPSGAR
jgi:hypothetical protein